MKLRLVKTVCRVLVIAIVLLVIWMGLTKSFAWAFAAIGLVAVYGVVVGLLWRCPRCGCHLGPLGVRFCPHCGCDLDRTQA